MSTKLLPTDVRSEILDFLDSPTERERTIASAELGYAITASKHGDEVRLSCPAHWAPDFVEYFGAGEGFVRVDDSGVTAHETILRQSLKTNTNGLMTRREKFALLDEKDRIILVSDPQRLRVVLLSIATARAETGKDVVVYSTFPSAVISMDLLEAAGGLGVRFSSFDHAPLVAELEEASGQVKAVGVPDTTAQQTPAVGKGEEADVFIYLDAGRQSFKQVRETALPAQMSSPVELIAGTARPLSHNRPPTGAQAALGIADRPRLYWIRA
jgi:hypothetical protein